MKTCTKIASVTEMSHDEWLNIRKSGIGGSDAGAIMGFNKYISPHEIFLEKTTEYKRDLSGNESVYWGNVLEPVVAEEFSKRTGKKVRRVNSVLQSVEHPFMIANIDRAVEGENAILECKTANRFLLSDWDGDEVPAAYICQCQHYMAVTGADVCYIACLVGGQKFIYKAIERDDEFIKILIDTEMEFWNEYVLQGKEPPMTGLECDSDYIAEKYPDDLGGNVKMTSDIVRASKRYMDVLTAEKELKKEKDMLSNTIKEYMGECSTAYSDDIRVDWKNISSSRIDSRILKEEFPEIYEKCSKVSTTRRFSIKKVG